MSTLHVSTLNLLLLYRLDTLLDSPPKFEGNARIFEQGRSKISFGVNRNR